MQVISGAGEFDIIVERAEIRTVAFLRLHLSALGFEVIEIDFDERQSPIGFF